MKHTDSSTTEQEIVYMRFSVQGVLHTYMLGIKSVQKADASHIEKNIDSVTSSLDENWKKKLVAIGTDGVLM